MTSEERVKRMYPDAVVDEFECDEGCKHYRIVNPRLRQTLCMYEDTPAKAWDVASRNIQAARKDGGK